MSIEHPAPAIIKERYEKLLKEKNFDSANKLAKCSGVDKGSLSQILNGHRVNPEAITLAKLSLAFKMTPGELLDRIY